MLSGADERVSSRSELVRKGRPIVVATLVSRPLGFVREAVQAALFGASRLTDAFLVAYNVPELIQTLFFSGVLSNVFVPVITRYRSNKEELSIIFSSALNVAFGFATILAVVGYTLSSGLMTIAAPGLSGNDHSLAVFLFRFMLPVLVFHCLLAVMKGTLNSLDHYAAPEYSGILFNVVTIVCALMLAPTYGIVSMAVGVVAGSLVQVLIQLPTLNRYGIHYRLRAGVSHPALNEMGGLALSAFVATAVVPVNAFVARALASNLEEGSISALAYAFRIFVLPIGVLAVPIYTVLLTELSAKNAEGKMTEFKKKADAGMSLLLATCLPATALLVALAIPITRLLYERGHFGAEDVRMTSEALMAYGVGIVGYGTSQVMVRLFTATKDTGTPALVGIASVGINLVGCWLAMQVWGHVGIALVISAVSYINAAVLYFIFRTRYGPLDEGSLLKTVITHLTLATFLGLFLFELCNRFLDASRSPWDGQSLLVFGGIILSGTIAYLIAGWVFRVGEIRMFLLRVRLGLSRTGRGG